jgi:ribosome-associated toxin RatA of RatAB toxin-antitoxin module
VYAIAAHFTVPEPAAVVQAVLTDYANIPRFMPGVRTSRVLEQTDGRVRLEQEAVSKFMMFSKKVHLVLEVEEAQGLIRFRDACHKSFVTYEGSWTISAQDTGTMLAYQLTAKPAFGVPGMVLRKLLDRDAREMIDGLRTEIAARASAP